MSEPTTTVLPDHPEWGAPKSPAAQKEALRQERVRQVQHREWGKLMQQDNFQEFLHEYLDAQGLQVVPQPPQLPHDLPAECACMGALLIGGDEAVQAAMARLKPWHLYHQSLHAPILRAVAKLVKQRKETGAKIEIDIVTIGTKLRQMGEVGQPGNLLTFEYLQALIVQCPNNGNIEAYIDPVIETARRRAVYYMAGEMQKAATAPECDALRLVQQVRAACEKIRTRGSVDARNAFAVQTGAVYIGAFDEPAADQPKTTQQTMQSKGNAQVAAMAVEMAVSATQK